MPVFHGMSGSRIGSSHEDDGIVCQDSTSCFVSDGFAVAAASDGHGGAVYFRSDVGSKAAAECAVRIIREFVESEDFETSFRSNQDVLLDNVCRTVLATWYSRIEDYDRTYPLTDEEKAYIAEKGIVEDEAVDPHHHRRYGATLMASVIAEWFAFCVQIGDGGIVCVGEDGKDFSPMPEDPHCRGNVTSSLCEPEPLSSFRYWSTMEDVPMAIVMSTDGVTNTFNDPSSYARYCRTASCFALDGGDQWHRLMDRNKARSDESSLDDTSTAMVCRECPELRRMKDDIDAKYRKIDERSSVSVDRRIRAPERKRSVGTILAAGPMEFVLSDGNAVMTSYRGDEETVYIPECLIDDDHSYEVSEIAPKCFDKSKLRHVRIPVTVSRIDEKAFYKCDRLEDVTFIGCPVLVCRSFFCCSRLSDAYHRGEEPKLLDRKIRLVYLKERESA